MLKQRVNNLSLIINLLLIYISNYLPTAIQFLFDTKNSSFWSTLIKLPKSSILNFIIILSYTIRLYIIAIVCWLPSEKLGFLSHYLEYDKLAKIFIQLGVLEPFICIAFSIMLLLQFYFYYIIKFSGKCKTWQYVYEMTILNHKSFLNFEIKKMNSKQLKGLNVRKLPNFPNLSVDVRIKVLLDSFKIKQIYVIFTILFGLLYILCKFMLIQTIILLLNLSWNKSCCGYLLYYE